MAEISDIVSITITRETAAVASANFGVPALISEFAASKTTTTFDRYRTYASLTEMLADGWLSTDKEYIRASKMFSQNPNPGSIFIGRKKPDSETVETWTEALTAIQTANQDWYAFTIDSTQTATTTFDADFITGNSIVFTINGIAVTAVPFNADNATTYADLKTQIEADITDSSVTINAVARTVKVEIVAGDVNTQTAVVTGGASQATGTTTYLTDDDVLLTAAWAETQKKIFFLTSNDTNIPTSSSSDILSQLKALNYDRSAVYYHPDLATSDQFAAMAAMGEALPYDPGSQTWAYKTLSGITAYSLTSQQRSFIIGTSAAPTSGKNGNIYTTIGGISVTERGQVVSGEYIDIIRGIDWLEARMGELVYGDLVASRKIPYTDDGIAITEGRVREALQEAAEAGLIVESSIVVTVPKAEDVSAADKTARILKNITFTATLQGAIHASQISGTVSV